MQWRAWVYSYHFNDAIAGLTNRDMAPLFTACLDLILNEWAEIFAKADTSSEPEFEDWDITLNDGENGEEL